MARVILFSHRPVFKENLISGPGIRIFEIAKSLQKKGHKVTIAEKGNEKEHQKSKIKLIPWNKNLLKKINNKYDVAILEPWNDEIDFLEAIKNIPTIVDLYSPILLEHAKFCSKKTKYESYFKGGVVDYFFDDVIMNLSRVIMQGDFFICANDKQKDYYIGMLNLLGIINPETYSKEIISIVPFGIESRNPDKSLKGLDIKKSKKDKLILWPGGIFPWLDAETVVKAMQILEKKHPKIKLVFVGANNPFDSYFTQKEYEKVKELAEELGLLNSNVFFHEWIPYNEREMMYNEAEIAIVLGREGFENDISNRTRIIDCLWGEIPVITSPNSSTSEIIERNDVGVISEDAKDLSDKILSLSQDKKKMSVIKSNIKNFKKELEWEKVIEPIEDFCSNPRKLSKKFNPYNLITEKQKSIEICEKEMDDKNQLIGKKNKQIEKKDKQIEQKDEQIKEQLEILNKKEDNITSLHKIINNQKKSIEKQNTIINNFKASIVYPLYSLTKKIGKTKVGKVLQKILK